ncbi:LysE family translocator [Uliginosibacterium sp. sgz301328]|uniref:LysE family translocator n=1 Tax=Uliginosibacterium sp. sgz301328 TaxID=3243764 RepID=UPI00359CE488
MQQFIIVATAHFLALLSPGPDFFLITRTALAQGWRQASAACLGIALGNGIFIVAAFAGMAALQRDAPAFIALETAGCVYLLWLGYRFARYAGSTPLNISTTRVARAHMPRASAWQTGLMGLLSAVLNPKNALFYATLAVMLGTAHDKVGVRVFYGVWMFAVVLLWDLVVAASIGNAAIRARFARALPWLERATGVVLFMLGAGVIVARLV